MNDPSPAIDLEALRHHEAWLRPMLRALVGDSDASDVLQRTWLRAWQRPPRSDQAVGAWLAKVAKRFAVSHHRSEQRRRRHEAASAPTGCAPSTAETVEHLAVQHAVNAAVMDLAEPYRTAVLLRHYHGLSVEAVAVQTNTSAVNVRQRVHRGLESMRSRLERELGTDWRRSPAVLAIAACPTAAAVPTTSTLFAFLLMNNVRLAAVASCMLLTAVLGWLALSRDQITQPTTQDLAAGASPIEAMPQALAATTLAGEQRTVIATAEPAPATTATPTIVGDVQDTLGRPVADVEVGVRRLGGGFAALGRADASGKVSVARDWPLGEAAASAPWFLLAVRSPAANGDGPAPLFLVAPGRPLTVEVRDESGGVLAGTRAVLSWQALVDYPFALDDATESTMAPSRDLGSGRHHWDLVPVAATSLSVQKPGYVTHTEAIDATTATELVVTMRSIAAGYHVITGTVTDARGGLFVGATVGLGTHRTTTDANGTYELVLEPNARLMPGNGLFAVGDGWYPAIVSEFGARVLGGSEAVLQQDLQVTQPSLTIQGRIVDHAGNPQPDVDVYPWQLPGLTDDASAEDVAAPRGRPPLMLSGNPVRAYGHSDVDGRFTVPGLSDRGYRLRLFHRQLGWAWTSDEIRGGAEHVVVTLPADLLGAVQGTAMALDGTVAKDLDVSAYVEVHARDGGLVSANVPVATRTDAEGRFHFDALPRYGVSLCLSGGNWISTSVALDPARGTADLQVVLPRRCHVRIQLDDPAQASATVRFVDATDQPIEIHEDRAFTTMTRAVVDLHDGKSKVVSISETAATMVVDRGDEAPLRIPVRVRPGEITQLRF